MAVTIPVEGGRLFARTWGPPAAGTTGAAHAAGPTILLFHDSLGCVELWRDFPALLAEATGRQVLAYDRLGFGRSDPHPGRIEPDFIALEARRSLPALLDRFGIRDFVACGHSVGGGMAVEVAARWPETCRGLVTIAAQAFVEDRTVEAIRREGLSFEDPVRLARLARYHGDKARWAVDAWTGTWLSADFAGWNLDAALAAVRCPVLALHGDRDEYGSTAHALRIAGHRGRAEILPDTGHLPHRERPGLLAEAIRRFLAPPF